MLVCYFDLDPSLSGDERLGFVLLEYEQPACSGRLTGLDSWWRPRSHWLSLESLSHRVVENPRNIQPGCWTSDHPEDNSGLLRNLANLVLAHDSLAVAGRSPLSWCTVEQAVCRGRSLGTVWAGLASMDQRVGTGGPQGLLGGRGRDPQGMKCRILDRMGWGQGRLDQC